MRERLFDPDGQDAWEDAEPLEGDTDLVDEEELEEDEVWEDDEDWDDEEDE